MTTALFLSMAAFSLAASISPGPVNTLAFSAGIRYDFRSTIGYVTGATVGFTVLLISVGFGLNELVARIPLLMTFVKWAGVLFLFYVAIKLAFDNGSLAAQDVKGVPTAIDGALLQFLNPKAWLASIAGVAAYAASAGIQRMLVFAAIYFVICYASVGCWALAGAALSERVQSPHRIRFINRILAVLLVASALYLSFSSS